MKDELDSEAYLIGDHECNCDLGALARAEAAGQIKSIRDLNPCGSLYYDLHMKVVNEQILNDPRYNRSLLQKNSQQ